MYSLMSVLIAALTFGVIALPSPPTGPDAVLPAEVATAFSAESNARAHVQWEEAERERARAEAEAEASAGH